ncbi:DUF401 family protein [Candidatus Ozemobacteraceae bacterium]|nr:DUF401 family protein [Candidatus Ozemobacteraceae bacterium]
MVTAIKRILSGFSLWSAILTTAVVTGLAGGRGVRGLLGDAATVTSDRSVLELLAIVVLIYLYSHLLQKTGRMERITAVLNRLFRDPRAVMVAVPGLVGLIPMPGGAMFTAPITDRVGNRMSVSREEKVFSNYWFRHCWELAFPLYPGIILCAGLARVEPIALTWAFLPLSATAFVAGLALFLVRAGTPTTTKGGADEQGPSTSAQGRPTAWMALSELWPLLGVIVLALFSVPLVIGLIVIIALFALAERVSPSDFWGSCRVSLHLPILALIWSVFLFGRELAETGMLGWFSEFLIGAGLPMAGLSFLLPFVMGALTGVTTGFVGAVFPLLLPMWPADQRLAWLQFAYASGLVGAFLTPSHLCLSMTQEFFKASLRKVVALVAIPCLAIMLAAWLRLP